jgi:prepilin-type N-terminal cleavage/methylation domain-containing protein
MHSFQSRNASRQSGGFTLVELLVVIGIIATLAAVALGPITGAIKKAHESGAMQTCRTIGLAEFQYANDNNGSYPDGTDAGAIASALVSGNYASDPKIFFIPGDQGYVPYTPAGTTVTINATAVSYNFLGVATTNPTAGLNSSTPDQAPTVWSTGDPGCTIPAGANTGTQFMPTTGIFTKDGVAVAYHSNNAFFRSVNHSTSVTFPAINYAMFVDNTFDPTTIGTTATYQIRKGSSQN